MAFYVTEHIHVVLSKKKTHSECAALACRRLQRAANILKLNSEYTHR